MVEKFIKILNKFNFYFINFTFIHTFVAFGIQLKFSVLEKKNVVIHINVPQNMIIVPYHISRYSSTNCFIHFLGVIIIAILIVIKIIMINNIYIFFNIAAVVVSVSCILKLVIAYNLVTLEKKQRKYV